MALDPDGLHTEHPGWITTYTRRRVDPLDLKPEDISIVDIAHALARQCRYNGHCGHFVSVARHSLWVADLVPPHLKLTALLHDAAEAYLGDLVRPIKATTELGRIYKEVETRAEWVIGDRFCVDLDDPVVKEADRRCLVELELPDRRWSWSSTPEVDEAQYLYAYETYSLVSKP